MQMQCFITKTVLSDGTNTESGIITGNPNTSYTITCGYKPSKVYIVAELTPNVLILFTFYDSSLSQTQYTTASVYKPNGTGNINIANLGSVTYETVKLTLTSTGFIYNTAQSWNSATSKAYYVVAKW